MITHQALDIWKPLVDRCPGSRSILIRVLKLAITCRDSEAVVRGARLALDRFGEHPDFLSSITTIKLHQRQPGLGQRSSLLAMVWRSLGLADVDISNQFSCYEMNGLVDWLEYVLAICDSISDGSADNIQQPYHAVGKYYIK